MARRLLSILALVLALLIGASAGAAAQDTSGSAADGSEDVDTGSRPDNTYGFDDACNAIHDKMNFPVPVLPWLGDAASTACKGVNAATHPKSAMGAMLNKAWRSGLGEMVDELDHGLAQAITLSLTLWTSIPNSTIADSGDIFNRINDYTYQIQILLLVTSVIVTGARLAGARRGAAMGEAVESFRMFSRVVFSSWMLATVVAAGTQASDRFATWLITDSTGGNLDAIQELFADTGKLQAFAPGLVLIIALVGLLGTLAQIILTIVRQGMLIIAVGALPLAAAASGLEAGRQAYRKLVAWIIAFTLWKPVAAIVYMIAFVTAGDVGDETARDDPLDLPRPAEAQRMIVALVLLCSVAFVLPALMRLIAPAVAIMGMGGSGLSAAGVALSAAVLPLDKIPWSARNRAMPGSPGYVERSGRRGHGRRGDDPPSGAAGASPSPSPKPKPTGGNGAADGGRATPAPTTAIEAARSANRSPDLGTNTIPR